MAIIAKKGSEKMKDIQAIREKRAAAAKNAKALVDGNGGTFSNTEQALYDKYLEEIKQADRDMKEITDFQQKILQDHELELGVANPENCAGIWRDKKGNPVAVLGPNHSFAGPAGGQGTYAGSDGMENVSAGAIMRALALGPQNTREVMALSEGTDSAGGYSVPDLIARRLIDLARAQSHVIKAGAMTVPLDTEKTTIVRVASDPVPGWRVENALVAESEPTFEPVTFQARSLAVLVKASRELLEDSVNVEQAIMMVLAAAIGNEIDRVSLLGSGVAPEPTGILNSTGVNVVDMGTDGAALSRYSNLLAAHQLIADGNCSDPTAAIMSNRERFAYADMVDASAQPLNRPGLIKELPFLGTTKLPVDLTHGGATNASNMYLGDFSQLMFGIRSGLRIEVLKERFAETMQIGFLCHIRMDIALAQPKAFTVIKGVIPA